MNAVRTIMIATIIEQRRQRLLVVPVIGFALSLLLLGGTILVSDESIRPTADEAELLAWVTGIAASIALSIYAIIVGAGLIAREIGAGTMLMLAARPIGRWTVIVGRALGAAVFLLATLVGACLAYAVVAVVLSGSSAPFDDPFGALVIGIPALLLGLAVGIAFSIQGKATAAIGSAMAVCIFATAVGSYASDWMREQHLRSYLTDEVRDQLPAHDPVIGRAAVAVTRAMPFFVFLSRIDSEVTEREGYAPYTVDGERSDGKIDTTRGIWGPVVELPPADPNASPAGGVPSPVDGPPADPDAAAAPVEPAELPDDPTRDALECAEWNDSSCLFGYRNAWEQRLLPAPPSLGDDTSMAMAWLAIPAWIGVAIVLLRRRRDLTD